MALHGQFLTISGQDEQLRITFQRQYMSFQFAFDKKEIQHKIDLLRKRNNDLQTLRSQARELKGTSQSRIDAASKDIPKEFLEVQKISSEVHGALRSSFRCADISHDEHLASLCLDVEYVENVRLKIGITYARKSRYSSSSFTQTTSTDLRSNATREPPLWFLLQPKRLEPVSRNGNTAHLPNEEARKESDLCIDPKKPNAETEQCNKSRKRKVIFAEIAEHASKLARGTLAGQKDNSSSSTGPTLDLGAIVNACHFLRQKCSCSATSSAWSSRIAFLKTQEMSRYVFYISTSSSITEYQIRTSEPKLSLYDHLQQESRNSITISHQMLLALKLCRAVLQFHSSPWLEEEWSLAQLQLLYTPNSTPGDLSLYLNSRLPSQLSLADREVQLDSTLSPSGPKIIDRSKSPLSAAQHRGVDNITLFCLGMALLEIAHWKPISELQEEYDNDQIDTARRLAHGSTSLGHWYDQIVKKCLRCDFAFGADLKNTALQRAIYSDVVCPLEDLVARLGGLQIKD